LSEYTTKEIQEELHKNDTFDSKMIDKKTGEIKKIKVPILKPENFGEDMAIDDKNIAEESYTIISNKNTGKIAMMIQTVKANIIIKTLQTLPIKILFSVKTISKDLAEGYDWIARTCFMNATRIADKFHVLKLGFEALQIIRIKYRQEELTKEREKKEAHKAAELEKREMAKRQSKTYKIKKPPQLKKLENGETTLELLARSRYLLFKFREDWTSSQEERANILFEKFPSIHTAHDLICEFRLFYKTKIGEEDKAKRKLKEWYEKISAKNIEEMDNFSFTVQKHEGEILNYFKEGHTNAYAENLNSRLQNFINSNSGARDRDFFHFRIRGYFS
jgi:transposase